MTDNNLDSRREPAQHYLQKLDLQKLALEGVLFRRAFSAAPACSPCQASLLTGQCAHQNGMLGLAQRGFPMADYSRHMPHTLRKAARQISPTSLKSRSPDAGTIS